MNILDEIFSKKREQLVELQARNPLSELKHAARDASPPRGFHRALVSSPHPVALIAEVKKASPSAGVIRPNFDPVELSVAYEAAGADCLSVLTDEQYFQGSTENLIKSRNSTRLPVLRKDFTCHEYHVYEARAMGADAVLLIVASLTPAQLVELRQLAESLGMDVLVEAHTADEGETALQSGAKLLGINNRDLATFETSLEVACHTIPQFSPRVTVVSESALASSADVLKVKEAGAKAVLIGTVFCRAADPGVAVKEVMGW